MSFFSYKKTPQACHELLIDDSPLHENFYNPQSRHSALSISGSARREDDSSHSRMDHNGVPYVCEFCAFRLCTDAQACTIAATDCTTPKNTVMTKTRTATQNVNHCVFFLSSHHSCEMFLGSASSKVRFSNTSRSLQYMNFSICLSELLSRSHTPACASTRCFLRCCWNHGFGSPSTGGTRRDMERIVSSTRILGRRLVGDFLCKCKMET